MSTRSTVKLSDVARHLGVSEATVSRVLNGKGVGFISLKTRERVLQAAAELGYYPNRLARGLATGQTGIVSLWIRNPDAPYYARMVRRVHDLAAAEGRQMILTALRDNGQGPLGMAEGGHFPASLNWPVDAVIAADCADLVRTFRRAQPKTVVVCIGNASAEDVDAVVFEVEAPVERAAEHLVTRGRRRIMHLSGWCSIPEVREGRCRAYERVLSRHGLASRVVYCPDETRRSARATVAAELAAGRGFDAVFCLNDDLALGTYRAVRDAGLRVPEDVAIVGCDDIEDVSFLDVPLTTISQPVEEACEEAWRLVHRRLETPGAEPVQRHLSPRLVVRASS